MLETSARLLKLLSLPQTHRDWPGAELAERLSVTTRTVRRDVERLPELGYPVQHLVEAPTAVGGLDEQLGQAHATPPVKRPTSTPASCPRSIRSATSPAI
ncbi:helix-turn-helix transcriptional regulator [Amycolatopsis magusensis]|uniref:Biotin operon repressor n=1 Tax=Amycolatopsis magusensis TaxID=882444 RepID=A0ABS4PWT2_9PSEU|nr:biotin operon repressor [Amycolatopsis magusensis]